jgi:hypothetical protein
MKLGNFLLYLRIQNSIVQELPSTLNINLGYSDVQLCRIYLLAMPFPRQSKFEGTDKTEADMSRNEMCTYFDKQHMKNPYKGLIETWSSPK